MIRFVHLLLISLPHLETEGLMLATPAFQRIDPPCYRHRDIDGLFRLWRQDV